MILPLQIYVFRDEHFSPQSNTIMSIASRNHVVSVFGGGGVDDQDGLVSAFGGAAVYKNDTTGQYYLGVWGARNASRFRSALRKQFPDAEILKERPPARLKIWTTS